MTAQMEVQIPDFRNESRWSAQMEADRITGVKPYNAIRMACPSGKDCHRRMFNSIKTVKAKIDVKEITIL